MSWELAAVGGVVGTSFIYFLLGNSFSDEHQWLKLGLFFSAIFGVLIAVNLALQFAISNGASAGVESIMGLAHLSLVVLIMGLVAYWFMVVFINAWKIWTEKI